MKPVSINFYLLLVILSSKYKGEITLYTNNRNSQLENRIEIDTLSNKTAANL